MAKIADQRDPAGSWLEGYAGGGINLKQLWGMPWVMGLEIRRILALPYARLLFAYHGIWWRPRWRIYGMPIIQRFRGSRIELGEGALLRSWPTSNPLAPNHRVVLATRSAEARIQVGRDVGMSGATIVAAERIEIGDRVFVGSNATIVDTDFHPLDPATRQRDVLAGEHRPVVLEDEVFVGMNSLILKGVRVGRGAVIGAGSVVTQDVPPGAVVAGNPARFTRWLGGQEE